MDFHTKEITAQFVKCASCKTEWRAYTSEKCAHCVDSIGTPLVLDADIIKTLMNLTHVMPFDDMENFEGIMEMIGARRMQAYWLYLRQLTPAKNVQYVMDTFKKVFERCVEHVTKP